MERIPRPPSIKGRWIEAQLTQWRLLLPSELFQKKAAQDFSMQLRILTGIVVEAAITVFWGGIKIEDLLQLLYLPLMNLQAIINVPERVLLPYSKGRPNCLELSLQNYRWIIVPCKRSIPNSSNQLLKRIMGGPQSLKNKSRRESVDLNKRKQQWSMVRRAPGKVPNLEVGIGVTTVKRTLRGLNVRAMI
ncbi:hypothetical protein Taro_054886 [Colocasia esculenta]|uniref:Uncharacterized protein n=1 Tax=Colocasia esculenta TaxID=4460 RepID=A0A843XRT8_COLES|nr:hypothetical protein [Colocasia esculenta]